MSSSRPTRPYSATTVPSMQPDETVREFAARMLEQHGPPPQHVVDMVHQLQRQAAAKRRSDSPEP